MPLGTAAVGAIAAPVGLEAGQRSRRILGQDWKIAYLVRAAHGRS